jgi:hypothetical protein
MKAKWIFLISLLVVLGLTGQTPAWGDETTPRIDYLRFSGGQLPPGMDQNVARAADSLTLAETAVTGHYQSPPLTAPIPFSALVPEWTATTADGATLSLRIRTAPANGEWGDWHPVHLQDDWMTPDDPTLVGDMMTVSEVDVTHTRVQFAVDFGRYAGVPAPTLDHLRLVFIDASRGPTTEELIGQQQALDAARGQPQAIEAAPKPFVISREVWCLSSACTYSDGLEYHPVSHMILHHTVSDNGYSDWAAVVRAIWSYHTYTRGWGDIGYNYLVDMNGVLYEGHYGGDNVVGTHAADANKGSMALSLLGTFTAAGDNPPGVAPPPAMLNSAVDLFAWKADQQDINVFEASDALPHIPWGLPTLMGHRDVYGGDNTACPGEQAFAMLPWLRRQVAERIGLTNPHLYVDELSADFVKSNANWYVAPGGCGHDGHAYYTWSTTDPGLSANWGQWRPNIPSAGRYEIEIYAPYCHTGAAETRGATYTVHHMHGADTVIIDQEEEVGLWMSLGEFDLAAGTENVIHLTDLTTSDDGRGVWFDAIRLRPVESAALLTAPAGDGWVNTATVEFAWLLSNATAVSQTQLRVATDAAFSQIVLEQSWDTAVSGHAHTFSQPYPDLYWQVIVQTNTGQRLTSATGHFRLDFSPPESAVHSIYRREGDPHYSIFWSGQDEGAGIAHYRIQYRGDGDAAWTTWLDETTATWAVFTPPDPGRTYWLRSQAVDQAGLAEPLSAGDVNTDQAILLAHDIMLPVITR